MLSLKPAGVKSWFTAGFWFGTELALGSQFAWVIYDLLVVKLSGFAFG